MNPAHPGARGRSLRRLPLALVLAGASAGVFAQELAADADGIRFSAAPYLWMAGMDGEVTVRGHSADVNVSFGDILSNLDMAFMGRFQAETGNWVFQAEPIYMKLSDKFRGPLGVAEIKGDVKSFIGRFTVGRAFDYEGSRLVAYAGIRYWSFKTGLELNTPGFEFDVKKTSDWVDPIVGGRFNHTLSGNWRLHLEGDVGGFGAGSEFSWEFTGLLGYDFSPTRTMYAGYQVLDVDYQKTGASGFGNEIDLQMSGPILGMHFRF